MNITRLTQAAQQFKEQIEDAITGGEACGRKCANGQKAKEALIRSQRLISLIHEVVKEGLVEELARKRPFQIHPALGFSGPELCISGFIKKKDQDVVLLLDGDKPRSESITDGPLVGETDSIGRATSERAIVVGVRSQMSSVAKNFDTLMERAFAETLNMRLRLPALIMGEVYLLPVYEYDDTAMVNNKIAFKRNPVPVAKFIRTFQAISGRRPEDRAEELYKYERTALVLVDFRTPIAKVYANTKELISDGLLPKGSSTSYDALTPLNFARDLIRVHALRHPSAA